LIDYITQKQFAYTCTGTDTLTVT